MLINPYLIAPAGGDPYFSSVVLLLHMDGINGSTTILDNSSYSKACTCGGGAILATGQVKFGTAALSCGGGQYVTTADSAEWDFGSGQFTVEAWVRPTSTRSGISCILSQWSGATITNSAWLFGFNGNTLNFWYSTTGTDNNVAATGAYTPTVNAWFHAAADRDASNVVRVYADGVVIGSGTAAATFFNSTRSMRVGNDEGAIRGLGGQIDDVRITKGVARYAGAFTPPTAAFPNS